MGAELLIPLIGSAIGGLGGLFGGDGTNKALADALAQIKKYLPQLQKGAFGKEELMGIGQNIRQNLYASGDIAAARSGAATGESGLTGQDAGSYHVSAVAPYISQGIREGERSFMDILNLIMSQDAASKGRLLSALQTGVQGSAQQGQQVGGFERMLSGILSGSQLGFDALGAYGDYKLAESQWQ